MDALLGQQRAGAGQGRGLAGGAVLLAARRAEGHRHRLPNGKNYGFIVNTQRILANKAFIDANPAARKLLSEIKLPIADINAQNKAMHDGANKAADIENHVNSWIRAHQQTFDQWIADAKAAAQ